MSRMTDQPFIDRQLAYQLDGEQQLLAHSDLPERSKNMVVLGEAGMGKSWLLNELARHGASFFSARRLIITAEPKALLGDATCVLIDAIDEAPAFETGGAIDKILGQLELAGRPRFILSCRAEDWQAATAKSIISETYGEAPLELHLKPFDEDQIVTFLTNRFGPERAREIEEFYRSRSLTAWLGNPQTLVMLADVSAEGELPETTSRLFADYVDLSLREANPVRRQQRDEADVQTALDTLGAAFAALILTGRSALAKSGAPHGNGDLRLSELRSLPGFDKWEAAAGNRLVTTVGGNSDRLTYAHRRIGEWLAARWLARHAETDTIRHRLFAQLTVDGIVPASLRGLFAWVALDDRLALRVIATDPMAVIEYGDADRFDERQGEALLKALEDLAVSDPWFAGWGEFRATSLIRGPLLTKSLAIIADAKKPDRLRMLLAKQFEGQNLESDTIEALKSLALDHDVFYALRDDAATALIGQNPDQDWPGLVEQLRCQGTHAATRLASNLILQVGFDRFDDQQVVETVFAACGHSICAVPNEGEDQTAARSWSYREGIPGERLEAILDLMTVFADCLLPEYRSIESGDIISLGDALIARRLRLGSVVPEKLLRWIRAFGGRDSYVADDNAEIAAYLRDNDDVRREIQLLWFDGIDEEEGFWEAAYRLPEAHRNLAFNDGDLASFLDQLPGSFAPWRLAARLIQHSAEEGMQTRAALRRFATDDAEYDAFLDGLLNPAKPEWQEQQEARAARFESEREERWAAFRQGLKDEQALLEQGRYGIIIQAAYAYTGNYSDLRDYSTADERLNALCGPEMIAPIMRGFEAYLNNLPPYPDVKRIAESYGESRAWNARYILIAALAARLKRTGGLGSLTTDQLVSAQLHIANQVVSDDEWQPLIKAVWVELVARPDDFEAYARLLIEPSLRNKQEILLGLYELLHQGRDAHPELIERLAEEWLTQFWRMHARPESELLDAVLAREDRPSLSKLIERRLKMTSISDERRRNWQAAALICDFDRYSVRLRDVPASDPGLFWSVRERLGARRHDDEAFQRADLRLAAWLVARFRDVFPIRERPSGVTSGDTNSWDATEAVRRLIDRIGSDGSTRAEAILIEIAGIHDGYRERALAVLAELRRNRAEQARATIDVAGLAAILTDGPPQNMPDLQAKMIELLDQVEAQVRSNDSDSWELFYRSDNRKPYDEERCRNGVIEILRQLESTINFSPEKHLGDDREGDIACEIGDLHLPIEVKGQWHDELWAAADAQLAAQQAIDHRADGYGVLLVLWFGDAGKKLKGPPRGSGIGRPTSPDELERALAASSDAARDGRVLIKVLDLSRA